MKKLIFSLLFVGIGLTVYGQKYFTKEGSITFHSDASMEKIEAVNNRVTAVLDIESCAVEFALLVKAFQFEKALMEEHFNENYMESDKYPKALFKGQIDNPDEVRFKEKGEYKALVSGDLTVHGVTNKVETEVAIVVDEEGIKGSTDFILACADYKIKIPKVVADNVAKEIEILVSTNFQPLVR